MVGLIDRLSAALVAGPGPLDNYWYRAFPGQMTDAGVAISPENAMAISTVYACTRVIAETQGAVPIITYQKTRDGKQRATSLPLWRLLHNKPNNLQTAFEWKEMMTAWAILRGRAVSEIVADPVRGEAVSQIMPIHPDRWRREVTDAGRFRYYIRDGRVASGEREVDQDRIFTVGGPFGVSVVEYARQSFGLAQAAERFGARFFGNGAKPSGVATHPKGLSTEAHNRLKADIREQTSGEGQNNLLLFEEGMTWTQVSLSNEDSQFLESRQHQRSVIAGEWFRLPPHKIGDLTRSTNNNIEHQSLEWVQDSVMPWCERWEQPLTALLEALGYGDEYEAEFLIEQLLRADIKTRFESYGLGIQWGFMSPNEARAKENMNLREGGDVYLQPVNMAPSPWEPSGPAAAVLDAEPAVRSHGDAGVVGLVVRRLAGSLLREEQSGVLKAAQRNPSDRQRFADAVEEFYDGFCGRLAEKLAIPEMDARLYCERHRVAVAEAGLSATETWGESAEALTRMVFEAEARRAA